MNSDDSRARSAPIWYVITSLLVLVLLAAHNFGCLLVFHTFSEAPMMSFLFIYPSAYLFGISMVIGRPLSASATDAIFAVPLFYVTGWLTAFAAIVVGFLSLGTLLDFLVPGAGLAFGVVLGLVQFVLFGYPPSSRIIWLLIHAIGGAIAAPLMYSVPSSLIFAASFSPETFGWPRLASLATATLFAWAVGQPHLLAAFCRINLDRKRELPRALGGLRPQLIHILGVTAAFYLIWNYADDIADQYVHRPPVFVKNETTPLRIDDKTYFLSANDIRSFDWDAGDSYLRSLTLAYEIAPDNTVRSSAGGPDGDHLIYVVPPYRSRPRTVTVTVKCRAPDFAALSLCWHERSETKPKQDDRWSTPGVPDFTASIEIPLAAEDWIAPVLVDRNLRYRASILPKGLGRPSPKLMVPDGNVGWFVALPENEISNIEQIIDAIRRLQLSKADGPGIT
jgi:hypothetical protein